MRKSCMVTCVCVAALACRAAAYAQPAPLPHGPQLQQRSRYRLHPGDVVTLTYRFTPDFNQDVTVEPDGFVNLNLVGGVMVGGPHAG